jgi:hypothetical protein
MWMGPGVVALFAIGCGSAVVSRPAAQRSEAALPAGSFVSDAYAFAIEPVAGWERIDEMTASELSADAVVMLRTNDGSQRYLSVHVEPSPGLTLDEYVDLSASMSGLERSEVSTRERVRFAGEDAVRFVHIGYVNGMPRRGVDVVFLRRGYGYHVRAWGGAGDPEGLGFVGIHEAFRLLDRPIAESPSSNAVADVAGPGWRLRSGRFESARGGFAVEPAGGWRPITGNALRAVNAGADIGYTLRAPRSFLLLFSERIAERDRDRALEFTRMQTLTDLGAQPTRARLSIAFERAPLELELWSHPAFEYAYGARCTGDRCVRVLSWWPRPLSERARRALSASAPAVRFLDEPARAELAASLDALPRHALGVGYALHGDTYTDFSEGVTLSASSREGWEIAVGDVAQAMAPGASVYLENHGAGVLGMVLLERLPAPSPGPDYDRAVREVIGAFLGSSEHGRFANRSAWVSEGVNETEVGTMRYRVYITTRTTLGVRLVFWGYSEFVERERAALDAIASGMSIADGPLPEHFVEGDRFVDARLAYRLRPPAQPSGFVDGTPANIRSLASVRSWSAGTGGVTVVALLDLADRSERTMTNMMEALFAERFQGTPRPPPSQRSTLAGRRCAHRAWSTPGGDTELVVIATRGAAYGLVFAGMTPAERDAVADTFEVID